LRRLSPDNKDDFARDYGERTEAPRGIAQERPMPFGQGQLKLNALGSADWNPKASCLAVEPIRLVLRLEHDFSHVRNRRFLPSFQSPSVGLQQPEGDLERGRDVWLVDHMSMAQVLVRRPGEARARPDVFSQGDADRLVHKEPEFSEKPVQLCILPLDHEYEGAVCFHGSLHKAFPRVKPPRRGARK